MLQIFAALALIALGMGVDAYYQRRIRIAECDAYETGYQQGKKEEQIREDARNPFPLLDMSGEPEPPSMAAPVEMPPTFAERLKKHGRATVMIQNKFAPYATHPGGYWGIVK